MIEILGSRSWKWELPWWQAGPSWGPERGSRRPCPRGVDTGPLASLSLPQCLCVHRSPIDTGSRYWIGAHSGDPVSRRGHIRGLGPGVAFLGQSRHVPGTSAVWAVRTPWEPGLSFPRAAVKRLRGPHCSVSSWRKHQPTFCPGAESRIL